MSSASRRRAKTAAQPRRVALDTGVLLHALLLSDDKAQRLRQAWQQGECVPLIGSASAQALMRALAYPAFKLDEAQQHELLADFLPYAEVVDEGVKKAAANALPTLLTARACGLSIDALVSDCPRLRASFARGASRSGTGLCRLLGSEEFLAAL